VTPTDPTDRRGSIISRVDSIRNQSRVRTSCAAWKL